MHWHFNPVLNASMLTAQAVLRVYMFHSLQFCAPVMSPFFCSHEPYDDITLDDVCPPFHCPRYPTDGESDSDTRLTLTVSVESDPSESSYSTYFVGSYRSEPSQPLVIHLSSDSSNSFASPPPPLVRGHGFIRAHAVPRERGHARGGGRGDDARWFQEWIPFVRWLTWMARAELITRIAFLLVVIGLSFSS